MNFKKIPPLFFFCVLLAFSLSLPVLASADSFGNQINSFSIYQKIAGVYPYPTLTTNATYSNMTAINKTSNVLKFAAETQLNNTLVSQMFTGLAQAVGIELTGDSTYYGGPCYSTPPYDTDSDFYYIQHLSEFDIILTDPDYLLNVTLWLDEQQNGTWVLSENWLFNITTPESSEYVPDTYNGLDLSFVWFWATVGSAFITAVSSGLAVKKISVGYVLIAVFAGMFTYAFYMILANGGG